MSVKYEYYFILIYNNAYNSFKNEDIIKNQRKNADNG